MCDRATHRGAHRLAIQTQSIKSKYQQTWHYIFAPPASPLQSYQALSQRGTPATVEDGFDLCHPLILTGAESLFWEHEVKDSERLEVDRLLKCNLEELIASVRPMSAENCERIARAILDRIGGPTFEHLLTRIIGTMVPRDGRGPPTSSDEYYFAIGDLFPQVPPENDVLGRLLCFAMRMYQLRIETNPNLTAH